MSKTKNQNKEQMVRVLASVDLDLKSAEVDKSAQIGFSTWVRTLQQNWRQGTVACQGRSDVSFSNKKPWKQKGTGRARAGSARSPLWRGGGVCHGPQPRVRTLKVSKNLKSGIFNKMFWDYLERGSILCINKELFQE